MGTVRTVLALAVLFTHTNGFVFVGGQFAVQLFYMISGFLISYVITEAKSYTSVADFYVNRFLRLFPIYWIVALVSLAFFCVQAGLGGHVPLFDVYRKIDPPGFAALAISNVTIFGQDWIMFTAVKDGATHFALNFRDTEVNIWEGLLVPQAWTLGLELTFYLLAPFLLKSSKLIFAALALSIALRLYFINLGFGTMDPWSYRFFPTELALFLSGALSHRFLRPLYTRLLGNNLTILAGAATIFVAGFCMAFFKLPYRTISTALLFGSFVLLLPLLFEFQRRHRWDRRIGDLSYPIYISHIFVLSLVTVAFDKFYAGADKRLITIVVTVLTFALSYIIERLVSERIEIIRARFRKRAPQSPPRPYNLLSAKAAMRTDDAPGG